MEKKEINGIIVLNKPSGISSNSASNKVKYLLNAKKAGHLGTLDPLGMGVLPVTLGKATKLFEKYLKKVKVYETIFYFGEETSTLDRESEVINKNDIIVTKQQIIDVLPKFIGEISQMPPQFSAKKVNGKKACDMARKGEVVELKPKLINIYDIKILQQVSNREFKFEVCCSSGTYIRSLCRDIAYELGTYGTMQSITRTKCGDFELCNSYTFDDIISGNYKMITLEQLEEK